jgi:lipopolysaccharide export system permease protein
MKIIYRSILKELFFAFILSLASLNFILMMEKLLRLSRFLSGVGTSILDMAKLIIFLQPQLFLLTIPMAFLLSILLVYGRLNIDNELVILRMSGMNFRQISVPVAVLGTLCFMLNIAVSFYIGPKSGIRLKEEIAGIIRTRTPLAIDEGRFNTSFKDTVIFVKEKPSENSVRGIFIYDSRNKKEPRVLLAKEGTISMRRGGDIDFLFQDGYINMVTDDSTTEMLFKKYNMVLKLEPDTSSRKNAELTPFELIEKMKTTEKRYLKPLYLELDRRLSLPLLCIVLIFFGPALSMLAGKTGKLGGLTIGLTVFTVYYMLLIYGENLARSGKISHYVGAWSPTLILGIFALFLFRKESRR